VQQLFEICYPTECGDRVLLADPVKPTTTLFNPKRMKG
jgi:hypothetical protein